MENMEAATPSVADLFMQAAMRAVQYISQGAGFSSQICVEGLRHPVWINVDFIEDAKSRSTWLYACTNDRDFLVPIPPSFEKRATDPEELARAIADCLSERLASVGAPTVRVFRRHLGRDEPLLIATVESGGFSG